jgi:hypothetical protein
MTTGKEIRAQIDSDLVKGLLIINGGGCISLLAFLPSILGKHEYLPLIPCVLIGIFIFQLGLVSAIMHNRLRRKCSLDIEQGTPPCNTFPLKFINFKNESTCSCKASTIFMGLSILLFLLGGLVVLFGGFSVICTST